jgi:hypothetical protein
MKAAEKEVEQLERNAREAAGLPVEPREGEVLPPVELLPFRVLQEQRRLSQRTKAEKERRELEEKVAELEAQILAAQKSLKALNEGVHLTMSPMTDEGNASKSKARSASVEEDSSSDEGDAGDKSAPVDETGAIGPGDVFVEFPPYDGTEPPAEWKKAFTQYCCKVKKDVKESMDPEDRTNKVRSSDASMDAYWSWTDVLLICTSVLAAKGTKIVERWMGRPAGGRQRSLPHVD